MYLVIRTMAAATQTAPHIRQIKQIAFITRADIERHLSIEQIPGGYQLPFATIFNLFRIYGHMKGRIYPTVDALLNDAAQGWESWREYIPLPAMTNREETAIIKTALLRAGIRTKSVRHYLGPVIIVMGRPEAYEGEFLQIQNLAWKALDAAPNARNLCRGIHVFSQFRGKLVAGYERFRRYER
jgi:hypothetical protein